MMKIKIPSTLIAFIFISILTSCKETQTEDIKISNLKTFADVYGYIKYFHPSDEASQIDWDKFSIYGASEVASCKTKKELVGKLYDLFSPIAPSIQFYSEQDKAEDQNLEIIKPNKIDDYKLTFWQHEGLGLGMNEKYRSVYNSVRVNSPNFIDGPDKFGRFSSDYVSQDDNGKEFKFEAWCKMVESISGQGHLRVQVIKEDGTTGFFDNMRNNPIKNPNWKKYEITGIIDSNAVKINLGAQLSGKGSFFIDKVSLKIKENGTWVSKHIANSDFEENQSFGTSTWEHNGVGFDSRITENESYSGSKALEIIYTGELKTELKTKIFDGQPKFGEFIVRKLSDSIYCKIPIALYTNAKGTFPISKKSKFDSLTNNINNVEFNVQKPESRFGNIINVYNVFRHFHPYLNDIKIDWDDTFKKALSDSYRDSTQLDHLITLRKFTSPLKDGHISVSGKVGMYYHRLPIFWEWINDDLVITNVYDEKLPLKIGDVVTHIEGVDVKDYFSKIYSTISTGNKDRLNYLASEVSIEGKESSKVTITIKNGTDIELIRGGLSYNSMNRKGYWMPEFKPLKEVVMYINLTKASMETIQRLMPDLQSSKAIIFDLRGYPNRNHSVLTHLMKFKDTITDWMKVPKIIYPDQENLVGFEEYGWNLEPQKPYLGDKKIIFLTNEKAISYAESIMGFVKGYNLGTIIGKPTAGTNGNINSFQLPGGYNIVWTGMHVTNFDGSQLYATGIQPDILIQESIESIIKEKDVYLERALQIIDDEID